MTDTKDDEYFFAFSATLRVFGEIDEPDEISRTLGLTPTHVHRRGERRSPRAKPYEHDMWMYEAPVDQAETLEKHVIALWEALRPNKEYLLQLKRCHKVDVICSYRTDCGTGGFELSPDALSIFLELDVPFGVSVIV